MIPAARKVQRADMRQMGKLAWPALCENLLATLVQFVDTAMVGALGAAATAAVAVNATPTWVLNGIVTAISVGGTALVARMIGAGDKKGAQAVCRQVFLGILVLSTVLFAAVMLVAGYIPIWMRANPEIHAQATAYMRIIALGFIPHFTGMALGAVLRGAGDTRTPMVVAAGANVLNIIGNWLLIFPSRTLRFGDVALSVWGADLGVTGAAISTAVSTVLAGLLMVFLITRRGSKLRLRVKGLRPDGDILRRILRIGVPAAGERVTLNVGQLIYVGMVASLGTAQLAAHHLTITVESLSYMPGYAFSVAATTLVGQALGRMDTPSARAYGRLSILSGIAIMSGIGVLLYALAPHLIGMLSPDAQVRAIGTALIRICAFEQPFMAMSIVAAGALRGAGDTRVPLLISLIGMWGVRIVLAWLFIFVWGYGINGAWYAMVIDVAVRGILMCARFARGKWALLRV